MMDSQLAKFHEDGYAVVRGLVPAHVRSRMLEVARDHLSERIQPLEYEADTQYPGAPVSHDAPGGRTVRRLLQAYARDPAFSRWATSRELSERLESLLGNTVELSRAHHNCVMTKSPEHSSVTSWHRDIRYWSFERSELVSVWLALGEERLSNGCLRVLPRSHAMVFSPDRLDEAQFLRTDVGANRSLLAHELAVELDPGDVLFFHCRLFHAAGRNTSDRTKFSVVFTYHGTDNRPIGGSRSASLPDVPL